MIIDLDEASLLCSIKIVNKACSDWEIAACLQNRNDSWTIVRSRCDAPRREIVYTFPPLFCRHIRIFCHRGSPISLTFVQPSGYSLGVHDGELISVLPRIIGNPPSVATEAFAQFARKVLKRAHPFAHIIVKDSSFSVETSSLLFDTAYALLCAASGRPFQDEEVGLTSSSLEITSNFSIRRRVEESTILSPQQLFALARAPEHHSVILSLSSFLLALKSNSCPPWALEHSRQRQIETFVLTLTSTPSLCEPISKQLAKDPFSILAAVVSAAVLFESSLTDRSVIIQIIQVLGSIAEDQLTYKALAPYLLCSSEGPVFNIFKIRSSLPAFALSMIRVDPSHAVDVSIASLGANARLDFNADDIYLYLLALSSDFANVLSAFDQRCGRTVRRLLFNSNVFEADSYPTICRKARALYEAVLACPELSDHLANRIVLGELSPAAVVSAMCPTIASPHSAVSSNDYDAVSASVGSSALSGSSTVAANASLLAAWSDSSSVLPSEECLRRVAVALCAASLSEDDKEEIQEMDVTTIFRRFGNSLAKNVLDHFTNCPPLMSNLFASTLSAFCNAGGPSEQFCIDVIKAAVKQLNLLDVSEIQLLRGNVEAISALVSAVLRIVLKPFGGLMLSTELESFEPLSPLGEYVVLSGFSSVCVRGLNFPLLMPPLTLWIRLLRYIISFNGLDDVCPLLHESILRSFPEAKLTIKRDATLVLSYISSSIESLHDTYVPDVLAALCFLSKSGPIAVATSSTFGKVLSALLVSIRTHKDLLLIESALVLAVLDSAFVYLPMAPSAELIRLVGDALDVTDKVHAVSVLSSRVTSDVRSFSHLLLICPLLESAEADQRNLFCNFARDCAINICSGDKLEISALCSFASAASNCGTCLSWASDAVKRFERLSLESSDRVQVFSSFWKHFEADLPSAAMSIPLLRIFSTGLEFLATKPLEPMKSVDVLFSIAKTAPKLPLRLRSVRLALESLSRLESDADCKLRYVWHGLALGDPEIREEIVVWTLRSCAGCSVPLAPALSRHADALISVAISEESFSVRELLFRLVEVAILASSDCSPYLPTIMAAVRSANPATIAYLLSALAVVASTSPQLHADVTEFLKSTLPSISLTAPLFVQRRVHSSMTSVAQADRSDLIAALVLDVVGETRSFVDDANAIETNKQWERIAQIERELTLLKRRQSPASDDCDLDSRVLSICEELSALRRRVEVEFVAERVNLERVFAKELFEAHRTAAIAAHERSIAAASEHPVSPTSSQTLVSVASDGSFEPMPEGPQREETRGSSARDDDRGRMRGRRWTRRGRDGANTG